MEFENIHLELDIAGESPEGRNLQTLIDRDRLSPEEAARRLLSQPPREKTPAEQMWGAFSSPEDAALMDEVMETVRETRKIDAARDFGL